MTANLFFKKMLRFLPAAGLIAVLLSANSALAAGGTLDPTFGSNGVVTTQFNSKPSSARDVALQSDGKILILGNVKLGDEQSAKVIARYNSNGALDTSFGSSGIVNVDVAGFVAMKMALQSNGKIILGGLDGGYGGELAVVRYLGNGALDTSFGVNGKGILAVSGEFNMSPADLAIQSDGKIVLVGDETTGQANYTDFFIARFDSNGAPDPSFVANGWLILDNFPNNRYNYGKAVVIQPDNKIVISGNMMDNDGRANLSLARVNPDGSLDKSGFGTSNTGTVSTLIPPDFQTESGALILQPDGKIIVGGTTSSNNQYTNPNVTLVRYNANGTLDASFGGTGIVKTDLGANETLDDLVLQADGKILVEGKISGVDSHDFLLARYNSDGSLDTSFGANGKVNTDFGNTADTAMGIVQQPDGKVIVSGASGDNAILARYETGTGASATTLNFESVNAHDGWILESGEFSNKGGSLDKNSQLIYVGDDSKDRQYRGILSFNTNSIPDNVTVTSAQVKIKKLGVVGTDPFTTHGNLLLEIRNGTFSNNIALTLNDFAAIANVGSTQDKFTAADGNWYAASLSNTNLGLINKYGITQFRLLFSRDDNDDLGADYIKFLSGNAAGDLPQLIVTYGGGGGATNQPPVITSNGGEVTANISLPENTTAVTTVTATDPDGQSLTYSISGGADAALFSINPSDGTLTFVTAPSYNAPNDAGLDHVYNVTVQVSDGTLTDSQEIVISILLPNPQPVSPLDSTFGSNGVVTAKFNGLPSSIRDIVLQPDGKIVVLGNMQSTKMIARYNSNGALDTSFGANGIASIDFPSFFIKALALQPDGKLVVAGWQRGFAAVRYNSNGSLDTSFGASGLAALSPANLSTDISFYVEDVTIQPDGKIALAGSYGIGNHIEIEVVRLNSDGTRDAIESMDWGAFGSQYNYGKAVVLQPDNKIVVSGDMISCCDTYQYISLARLDPDFRLDRSTFGSGKGVATARLNRFQHGNGALALQPDGKIVLAGYVLGPDWKTPQNMAMARFNTDGSLDTAFGGTGIVVTDFGAEESAAGLVVQASGKIIVAGTTSSAGAKDFLLVRYNSDGSLDTSFGANGKVITDLGNANDVVSGIVQQPDGRVIVSGTSGENAILARYNTGTSGSTTSLNFNSVASHDGWILESGEFTNKGGSLDKVSNLFFVGDDDKDRQYRSLLSFDTNSIPDNVTITSAQVRIKKQGVVGADPFNTHGSLLLEIRNGTFNNDAALTLEDFSAMANVGSTQDTFSAAGDGWYAASLSNINLGLINKSGMTQFRLSFSRDDNDNLSADYAKFFSGNSATDVPQLVLTYSTGGGTANQAPVIYGGASLSVSILENSTTVTRVTALDPDGQPVILSLSGVDASKFSFNPTTGILTFLTAPDYEAIPSGTSYHVTVRASDGSLTSTRDIAVTVKPVNEFAPVAVTPHGSGPVITISVPENTVDVTTITVTDADLPPQTIEYVFAGGADDFLFTIDPATGKLSFLTPPVYNAPNDSGLDHIYNIKFEINDGEQGTSLELVISIINPNNPNPAAGFTALHQFGSQPDNGRVPYGSLTLYNGVFYGTTTYGGPPYNVPPTNPANKGNVFKMNLDGSGFTVLHEFMGGASDGWKPWSGLAISGDMIYGSTVYGGPRGESGGVLYEMDVNGNGFRILHAFGEPGDGFGGSTSPTRVENMLFGLTRWGGNGTGTIYSYNTTTEVYKQLYRFAANSSDGNAPLGTLTMANDGYLYGLTWLGGRNNMGTLFRIRTDGSAFETLYHFSGGTQGKYPYDTLVFDNNHTLYGTTLGEYGVNLSDLGVVFKYDITSKAYSVLHRFVGGANDSGKPNGSVVLSPDGMRLYGTTHGDDAWGGTERGILYRMNIDGTGFTQLHEFKGGDDGATPMRTPLLVNGALYGMTAYGGSENYGLIYRYQPNTMMMAQASFAALSVDANSPVFTSPNSISVSENTLALMVVTATDADIPAQPLTYSIIGGPDSALFSLNPSTGELVFGAAPNYEIPADSGLDNTYNLTLQVSDGVTVVTQDFAVTITSVNDSNPVVTSGNAISVSENIPTVTTITATDADIPSQPLTYAIIGGPDAARFAINSSTGELTFVTAPDFDLPADAGADNLYNVTVQASDGELVGTQDVAVTLIPINDNAPVITSIAGISVTENNAVVTTVTATDADLPPQPLTYSIAGGADSTLFAVNPSTGELTFTAAPDFEMQKDAGMDNVYNVTIQASDGTFAITQDMAVTVTPVNDNMPVIASPASFSIPENSTAVTILTATDADLPTQPLTYSIIGGVDSALFTVNSSTSALDFVTARDYEAPNDAGGDNIYNVTIQVSDGAFTATQELAVTVLPLNDNMPVITSPDKFSIPENTTTIATLTATDADRPTQPLTYSIIGGADAAKFSIVSATGELTFVTAPDFETPTDTNLDNIYEIVIQVSDGTSNVTKNITAQVMYRAG